MACDRTDIRSRDKDQQTPEPGGHQLKMTDPVTNTKQQSRERTCDNRRRPWEMIGFRVFSIRWSLGLRGRSKYSISGAPSQARVRVPIIIGGRSGYKRCEMGCLSCERSGHSSVVA